VQAESGTVADIIVSVCSSAAELSRSAWENLEVDKLLPKAHIVYCESRMLLDRGQYESWRDIQDAYQDYKASLGPWSEAEILEFLEDEYGSDDDRWGFTRQAIAEFFRSGEQLLVSQDA